MMLFDLDKHDELAWFMSSNKICENWFDALFVLLLLFF